jgi:hypothetical protein
MKYEFDRIINITYQTLTEEHSWWNTGLSDVVEDDGNDGTLEKPFKAKMFVDLYLLAGIIRDHAKQSGKTYYFKHNGTLYKATGENKLITVNSSSREH